jgi:folate-binding protein YgfZ
VADLRRGASLVVRAGRSVAEATGADRTSYLHRMLSQEVASLAPMHATYACVLTPTGRILGDPFVLNLGDRFLLEMSEAAAANVLPALERYVIADDVTFRDVGAESARFAIVGEGAAEAIRGHAPAPGAVAPGDALAPGLLLYRRDVGTVPCFEGIAPAGAMPEILRRFPAPASADDLERLRVEEGVPAYGAELDERVLPNEANLESALSWTKGCYPGQEPVVMAKHRGHPPNRLARLDVEGDRPPPPDAPLLDAGRAAGRVTSAVRGSGGGIVALGYVRHALARPGAVLALEGGARVVVRALV